MVVGVHGAGWANLIFAGPGTYVVEMALAEPHAIYAAHLAYASCASNRPGGRPWGTLGAASSSATCYGYTYYGRYALEQRYFWLPLQGAGLHSAPTVVAPVARLRRVLREIVIEIEAEIATEVEVEIQVEIEVEVAAEVEAEIEAEIEAEVEMEIGAQASAAPPASAPPLAAAAEAAEAEYSHVELVVARYEEEWHWCAEIAREMPGTRALLLPPSWPPPSPFPSCSPHASPHHSLHHRAARERVQQGKARPGRGGGGARGGRGAVGAAS